MPYRNITIPAIVLLFVGTVIWTFTYGPVRRGFVSPEKTVTLHSAGEIEDLWESTGVRGRTAVIFARHLNLPALGSSYPDGSYLDTAMRHGMVRKAYYVVPDRVWPETASLQKTAGGVLMAPPQVTRSGYFLLHEGGRIYVMPLSKYNPIKEKALVVIESAAWSPEEHLKIDHLFRLGLLSTDLMIVVDNEGNPSEKKKPARKSFH